MMEAQVFNNNAIYVYFLSCIVIFSYQHFTKRQKVSLIYATTIAMELISQYSWKLTAVMLFLSMFILEEYLSDDKVISREVIDKLVSDNIDNIMYEFTNAVLDRDYEKISKMYNDFKIENVGYDYLIGSLGNALRGALVIKMLYNQGNSNSEIAKFIGKKEFYIKKMIERLYNYTVDDLCILIDKLGIIDREYKSGKSNIDMLELYLLGK